MSKEWYVYKDQQQKGPFTWEQLWQQASSGAIGPSDQVWTEGMAGWTRGDQVTGLFPKPVAPPRPTSPPAVPPVVHSRAGGSSAPPFQPGASGPFSAVPPKKRGKGGLVALIIVLLVVLLGGGIFAYKLIFNDGIDGLTLTAKSDSDTLIGSWRGVDSYGDEGYLKFNTDGTMHIASSWDGIWYTVDYRIEEVDNRYCLEINDYQEWERAGEIEFVGKDKLLVTELYDGEVVEVFRISDQQFQSVIDQLDYYEW